MTQVEPIPRRSSFSEEIKSQLSSRRSSAASSTASTSRRQSGSSLIMSRRGSYSVVREEVEEREVEIRLDLFMVKGYIYQLKIIDQTAIER